MATALERKVQTAVKGNIDATELLDTIENIYEDAGVDVSRNDILRLAKSGQIVLSVCVTCYDENGDYVGEDCLENESDGDDDEEEDDE